MRRNFKIVIMSITLLALFLATSYCVTSIVLLNNKKNSNNNTIEATKSNNDYLEDKIKISLSKGLLNETNKSLAELKQELGIEGEVTEDTLTSALSKKGYVLTEASSNVIYYNRSVVPNKYYIMECNDFLAIYKSDENCKLSIENETEDVYDSGKKFSHLRDIDRERMQNYEMEYNSKMEAEQAISELIS